MSYITSNKKGIIAVYESTEAYNSFCQYQDGLPSSTVLAVQKIQQDMWSSLANPKDSEILKNALISGANPNESKNQILPLHLILKSKNKEGLDILLKYTTTLHVNDERTCELAHQWSPTVARQIQNSPCVQEITEPLSTPSKVAENLPFRESFHQPRLKY